MGRRPDPLRLAFESVPCPTCGALPSERCVTMDRSGRDGFEVYELASALGQNVDAAPVVRFGGRPTNPHNARMAWAHSEGRTGGLARYAGDRREHRNAVPVFDADREH